MFSSYPSRCYVWVRGLRLSGSLLKGRREATPFREPLVPGVEPICVWVSKIQVPLNPPTWVPSKNYRFCELAAQAAAASYPGGARLWLSASGTVGPDPAVPLAKFQPKIGDVRDWFSTRPVSCCEGSWSPFCFLLFFLNRACASV